MDVVIGALPDIVAITQGTAGTRISVRQPGIRFHPQT
jgi:carbamate kinase